MTKVSKEHSRNDSLVDESRSNNRLINHIGAACIPRYFLLYNKNK
jgi:hypothetical protein